MKEHHGPIVDKFLHEEERLGTTGKRTTRSYLFLVSHHYHALLDFSSSLSRSFAIRQLTFVV